MSEKNIFDGVDINRLEKALSHLYSSVNGVEIKVTLTTKEKQREKSVAATTDFSKNKP